ncbi:HesA/MoeB/ThiF family protein [Methanoregula formicica]|jgi:adenylyltransferase/sulfurtransferase|uniref:Dinucleotide-utilizing enzyme possibly involved in molybdopterin or thiamin biosynthesis n=1 Tax=Methanoregula formicica (strain DSM 22288 / NBRC 105244 / SMSP) TaxID=593750 RepID=L0HFD6_METFS|nr:HesA/MoeB/ThiF family protein [Methanoregula formicica]AGB03457.1 dinucleotide-utilizing enzyme possibly involved in molybdopterin or thiamin biosynthesis [Methanoregula formicica SMSP]
MLSERERERYKRQILLFGNEGQERLKSSHIFIAGAGGLGSPAAIYLAVAGVGEITIVDMDTVDQSNLNRQILHTDRDIGKKKTVSAIAKLREYNPDIIINAIDTTITADNIRGLVGQADGIVDAMDNYPVRYLLNRVALEKKIPFFHGAIRGFYGQATTILPEKTPCLACIFPRAPPKEVFPVVGATPGVIGTIQATEVVKYLTKQGELLAGRLFLWDGLAATSEEIALEKNPACPVCGSGAGTEPPARMIR